MIEEGYVAALTYSSLIEPIFDILDREGHQDAIRLREAMRAADSETPGFLLQLVRYMLNASGLSDNVELYETILRIQNRLPDASLKFKDVHLLNERNPVYDKLSEKCLLLRNTLARIPAEIIDYRLFVRRTLEDVAEAMKGVLTAIDNFKQQHVKLIDDRDNRLMSIIDRSRKEFVLSCRDFVTLLKNLIDNKKQSTDFHQSQLNDIYKSALRLIFQILSLIQLIRENFIS